MLRSLIAIGAASLLFTGAAAAQNGSDISGPPPTSISGGAFVPLPSPRPATVTAVGDMLSALSQVTARFTAATPDVKSPITGAAVEPRVAASVGSLITSYGTGPASASISAALTGSGFNSAAVNGLLRAMAGLASGGYRDVAKAVVLFNALIASASTAQLASPSMELVALHAALAPMATVMGGK